MLDEQPNPYNKAVPVLVEIDGTNKPVEVAVTEGDVIEIQDPNDGKPIEVTIDHDNKQVMLHKEGFKSAIEPFNLRAISWLDQDSLRSAPTGRIGTAQHQHVTGNLQNLFFA